VTRPIRCRLTVDVDRPIEEVWAWLGDAFNAPRLRGMMLTARMTSPPPIREGSTFDMRAVVLGFETRFVGEVLVWDPPNRSKATAQGRPVRRFTLTESFAATPAGTRVVREMEFELPLLLRIAWPVIGPLVLRRWGKATARIKDLIERGHVTTEHTLAETVSPIGVRRTFMVTDITGSTQLIGVIGDEAWRHLRRWHDASLRSQFLRHEGAEVDHAGDGFLVAFHNADAAVACAIAIQRALAEHRRTSGFAPNVRIGLHTGEVHRDGAAFVGAVVHVAARVAELSGGGEIRATGPTLAEADLTTIRRDAHTLRGVDVPTEVGVVPW
jgi:class 3 adenylate cyclase